MNYFKYTIHTDDEQLQEEIAALISDNEYITGFEQQPGALVVYGEEHAEPESEILEVLQRFGIGFAHELIKEENWNRKWEEEFQPIILEGFCCIRAAFHPPVPDVQYDLLITPKMAFGTGHHATTRMMMKLMKAVDFKDKTVFDFGTGSGILALLASKLGARNITGVDTDHWSSENAAENADLNGVTNFKVLLGSIGLIEGRQFDIVLANINRNILLDNMDKMYRALKPHGKVLMSGILAEQADLIKAAAEQAGLSFLTEKEEDGWKALTFEKMRG